MVEFLSGLSAVPRFGDMLDFRGLAVSQLGLASLSARESPLSMMPSRMPAGSSGGQLFCYRLDICWQNQSRVSQNLRRATTAH